MNDLIFMGAASIIAGVVAGIITGVVREIVARSRIKHNQEEKENNMNDYNAKEWIGVDLDGTLAEYHGWQGFDHIGAPIIPMVKRVRAWLEEGKTIKIFTARVSPQQSKQDTDISIIHINSWCLDCFGRTFEITCVKDLYMVELWDDRCRQVVANTGFVIDNTLSPGIGLIAAERQRQIFVEGYDANHDKQHPYQTLMSAAHSYLECAAGNLDDAKDTWPWSSDELKPTNSDRDLVKAGALIAAAIDRYKEQEAGN